MLLPSVWLVQLGRSIVLPYVCLIVFLEMRQPEDHRTKPLG